MTKKSKINESMWAGGPLAHNFSSCRTSFRPSEGLFSHYFVVIFALTRCTLSMGSKSGSVCASAPNLCHVSSCGMRTDKLVKLSLEASDKVVRRKGDLLGNLKVKCFRRLSVLATVTVSTLITFFLSISDIPTVGVTAFMSFEELGCVRRVQVNK